MCVWGGGAGMNGYDGCGGDMEFGEDSGSDIVPNPREVGH